MRGSGMSTTIKIEELKPGRELDALVAERVMGLKISQQFTHLVSGYDDPEGWADSDSEWAEIPHYSSNLDSAFEVVEKLKILPFFKDEPKDKGVQVRLEWNTGNDMWTCRVWNYEMIGYGGETLAHAICLTALEALGAAQ
jgi:hypothetical protein